MRMNWIFKLATVALMAATITFSSCKKDDEEEPTPTKPVASFQYAISETNFMEVVFTNFSQNATTYSWNFGDGNTSTEENPTHVFAAAGSYTVVLTAKNAADASATFEKAITITDPNTAYKL